ncbi:MAG: hypothetical protein Q9160_007246 [Pyrenula sp. 1 TL-2023]
MIYRLQTAVAAVLFASSAQAFYPYQPSSGSSKGHKRFFPWQPSTTEEPGSFSLSLEKHPTSRLRRGNNYPVVKSDPPDVASSMAIDEDGQDYSYFSIIQFGSSKKPIYMLLDSGAANTWLMGTDCSSDPCRTHNTFGKTDSKTLQISDKTWDVTYGTGQVSGDVATDTIAFAGFTLDDFGFGTATNASKEFKSYVMDGILGLGRAKSNEMGTQTVMDALEDKKLLKSNILGVHLQRNSDKVHDGVITFGDVDKQYFDGDLSYTKTISDDGLWEIPADGAGVGDKKASFPAGITAIIDTGTSYVLMPPDDAAALHTLIPGSKKSGETYTVPCDTKAPAQFTLSGVAYDVSPADYVTSPDSNGNCRSNIVGHQAFGPHTWLLGDVFLKNVYTVFDYDQNRVGFGVKKAGSSTSTSTSSPSSSDSSSTSAAAKPSVSGSEAKVSSSAKGDSSSTATAASGSSTASSTSAQASGGASQNVGLGNAGTALSPAHSLGIAVFSGMYSILTLVLY